MAASREKQANRRIRLLLALFTLVFAGLLGRGFWIQGVQAGRLSKLAQGQHQKQITTPAGRGTIFDRTGVQLAIGEQMTTVFADPQQVVNASAIAIAAHKAFGVDQNGLYPALMNKKSQFVYVKRFADPAKAALFLKKGFAGISSYQEERRAYPQGGVGSQLIGYAGIDNRGLGGLEFEYDHKLAGHSGKQTVVRDATGRSINVISSSPVQEGADVFTTIDHTIQANAEQVLRATVSKWGAKSATAIVLDPTTGEVLAMAQAPGYNANNTSSVRLGADAQPRGHGHLRARLDVQARHGDGRALRGNRQAFDAVHAPVRWQYSSCFNCNVHDAEQRGTVNYSVAQILEYSSNVGAVTLATKLGASKLSSWVDRFGFGHQTGIDYPGESPGFVLPLAQWYPSTIGNMPIGQGISVTPIQMASAYAAVANNGVWVQPHLVDRVGGRAPFTPTHRRIMSPAVDHEVKAMLKDVVQGGTGVLAAIPGYTVAGKTGTGQVPDGHGGYSTSDYEASFVGMVPASKPRLVVLVKVDEPRGAIFGGVVAAPAFQAIAKFDLQYLGVTPDAPRTALSAG